MNRLWGLYWQAVSSGVASTLGNNSSRSWIQDLSDFMFWWWVLVTLFWPAMLMELNTPLMYGIVLYLLDGLVHGCISIVAGVVGVTNLVLIKMDYSVQAFGLKRERDDRLTVITTCWYDRAPAIWPISSNTFLIPKAIAKSSVMRRMGVHNLVGRLLLLVWCFLVWLVGYWWTIFGSSIFPLQSLQLMHQLLILVPLPWLWFKFLHRVQWWRAST